MKLVLLPASLWGNQGLSVRDVARGLITWKYNTASPARIAKEETPSAAPRRP
jgi:hypothetical protein